MGSNQVNNSKIVTKALPVRVAGTDPSADLGGSSKYSNEIFED